MLPGRSCCMIEFLADGGLLLGRERAADLAEHLGWVMVRATGRCRLPAPQRLALVGMGDRSAQAAPQPLDPVGLRVIGRGVDSTSCSPSSASRACSSRDPWAGGCPGCPGSPWRCGHGPGNAERRGAAGRTAVRRGGRRPAASPACRRASPPAEAVLFAVGARRLDQPLPRPASARPDPGQGRVQGDLDLVLEYRSAWTSSPSRWADPRATAPRPG